MNRVNKVILAAAALIITTAVPLAAQTSMSDEAILITKGQERAQLEPRGLALLDWADDDQSDLTSTFLGFYSNGLLQTAFTHQGINFIDGTMQQSAAYSKSEMEVLLAALTPVTAWPMVCKTTLLDGTLPAGAQYATLFCRSPQTGVPGGTIGSGAGVPTGYYFVVTDALAVCGFGTNCDGVFFRFSRRNIGEPQTDVETWSVPLSPTTAAGDTSARVHGLGPLMILAEGDYLVGAGSLSTTGGHTVRAQVMGYLTANPERFRP